MGVGNAQMNVCVQGLWHLGTVTAACIASLGNRVVGLDFDAANVARLNGGLPPILEAGLETLVKQGLASERLHFSSDPAEAVRDIEVLWIAYDTPVDDDDIADVDYVIAQFELTLPHVPNGTTIVVSSQMPVGSIRKLESIARARCAGKEITFAYSPENLRLGKAIEVFLKPDRIVVGVRSDRDRERLQRLLQPITQRIEWMSVESAEMTKHAINAFLAISVAFSNEIASICEKVGADGKEVERGLKSENRIGPKAYLSPGAPFAGGTLARDISFLNEVATASHLTTPLLSSVKASNDGHKSWTQRKLQALFPAFPGIRVAIWGLTYKVGTDTLRRSLAVELCTWLIDHGVQVSVHDPAVRDLPEEWGRHVRRSDDPIETLRGANALVISTEWPQYRAITSDSVANASPGIVVLDANRYLSTFATDPRFRYVAVGTPEQPRPETQ
jgi:UDPglucose 6-dehydrogenase